MGSLVTKQLFRHVRGIIVKKNSHKSACELVEQCQCARLYEQRTHTNTTFFTFRFALENRPSSTWRHARESKLHLTIGADRDSRFNISANIQSMSAGGFILEFCCSSASSSRFYVTRGGYSIQSLIAVITRLHVFCDTREQNPRTASKGLLRGLPQMLVGKPGLSGEAQARQSHSWSAENKANCCNRWAINQ